MERIFETQSAGYGQMMLGVARATKAKVSGVFTALKLPKFLVSMLTWGVLLSLGLMLAGLIAFVALIYFALTNSSQSETNQQTAKEETDDSYLYRPEFSDHPGNLYYQHWDHE